LVDGTNAVTAWKNILQSKMVRKYIAVRNRNHLTATENHMPYGITQCFCHPAAVTPAFTPTAANVRFSDPRKMQSRVYLAGGYIPR